MAIKPTFWLENVVRPAIVGAMVACVMVAVAGLLQQVAPAWNNTYLPPFCALAAVEAYFSWRVLHKYAWYIDNAWKYRIPELGALSFVLKLTTILSTGAVLSFADFPQIDPAFFAGAILVGLSWLAGGWAAADLDRLADIPDPGSLEVPPFDSLSNRFLGGAVVLVLATGLTRVGVAHIADAGRLSVPGLVLNVLVYFVLGVLLLTQARYTGLVWRWQSAGTVVSPMLAGRWVRYSLVFLSAAAILAFLLPTAYTLNLLDTLRGVANVAIASVWATALLIGGLVLLPLAWLISLLGLHSSEVVTRPPPTPPPPPPPDPGGGDWLGLLRSVLFWAVMVLILVYMVRSYIQHAPRLRALLSAIGPLPGFSAWWRALAARARKTASATRTRLARALPRRAQGLARPDAGLRGRNSPRGAREQVQDYYLRMVRRAGEQGIARRPGETPLEYGATLAPLLPDASPDLGALTDAFLTARYSPHPVAPTDVTGAETHWEHVKGALAQLKRPADTQKG